MIPLAFEFLAEAERFNRSKEIEFLQRLSKAQATQPSRPSLLQKVVSRLSDLLTDAGQWLGERYVSPDYLRQGHVQ